MRYEFAEGFKVWTGNNHPEEIYSDAFLKTTAGRDIA
jgi:hypothetical protein